MSDEGDAILRFTPAKPLIQPMSIGAPSSDMSYQGRPLRVITHRARGGFSAVFPAPVRQLLGRALSRHEFLQIGHHSDKPGDLLRSSA